MVVSVLGADHFNWLNAHVGCYSQCAYLIYIYIYIYILVSSGGLAVEHPALSAKGDRFDPRKKSKLFQRLIFSAHNITNG